MPELFTIQCTTCRARLKVKDASLVGTIVNCPKCHSMVQIVPPVGWEGDGATSSVPGSTAAAGALSISESSPGIMPSAPPTPSAPAPESTAAASAPSVPPLPRTPTPSADPSSPATTPEAKPPMAEVPAASGPVAAPETLSWSETAMSRLRSDWLLLTGGLASGVLAGAVAWWIIAAPSAPEELAQAATSPGEQTLAQPESQPQDELPRQPAATAPPEADEPVATAAPDPVIATQTPDTAEPLLDATSTVPSDKESLDASIAEAAVDASKDSKKAAVDPPAAAPSKPSRPSLKLEPAEKADSPINPFDLSRGGIAVPPSLSTGSPTTSDDGTGQQPSPLDDQPADGEADSPQTKMLSQADVDERLSVMLDDVKFVGVPLAQFVDFVSDVTTLPISIDDAALAKAGKRRSMPVSVHLSDTTAQDAFRSALVPLGLTYELQGSRLMVTVSSAR